MNIKLLFSLFFLFINISLASFGGIFSIWAQVHEAIVVDAEPQVKDETRILTVNQKEYEKIFGIAQIIPGPISSGLTILGYKKGGIPAMIAIYLGLLLPGMIFIPLLTNFNDKLQTYKPFKYFIEGASVSIIALLIYFFIKLLITVYGGLKSEYLYAKYAIISLIIIGIPFLSHRFKISPFVLIIGSASIGFFLLD